MTADRYICCSKLRAAELAKSGPANITGIDYVEVAAGATTALPTTIAIMLVKPPPAGTVLTPANIALTGGVRYPAPVVSAVADIVVAGVVAGWRLTIAGNQPTDYSAYRLAIVTSPSNSAPPPYMDVRLAAVDISFKIACASDFDCAPCDEDDSAAGADPVFDYRVRDYPHFRQQILDRMTELVPGFRQDDPVDLTTTLIEAAAYLADQQSYRLDWIGTEAFLQTARSRASIARHARLLDYSIGEGVGARLFAQFDFKAGSVADGMELAAGTPLLARIEGLGDVLGSDGYRALLASSAPIVFETAARLKLWAWRSHIAIHTWSEDECMLPAGSTAATLVDGGAAASALKPGDFLLLVETASPETTFEADARPERRHVVRLTRVTPGLTDILAPSGTKLVAVEWGEEDALPFDLVIQARTPGSISGSAARICAEARGNIMLADHGASYPPVAALGLPSDDVAALTPSLTPAIPVEDEAWRPVLDRADVARVKKVDLGGTDSAASLAAIGPAEAEPWLFLDDDFGPWTARRDLLRSGRFDRDFVIETGIDGRPSIRFGDGINGLSPAPQSLMTPRGRFGSGIGGNLGEGALAHVVVPAAKKAALLKVTNPLPGRGGANPEPVAAIRIAAPQAFRVQERAVTEADYATAAMACPDVASAVAVARWTGAWQTILVYVDRKEGRAADAPFLAGVAQWIESYRLMGFDVAMRAARPAPLEVELRICVIPGAIRSAVAARVLEALRPAGMSGGARGFFHPDNFSFGTPLYASSLIEAVMAVEEVESARLLRFQRLGHDEQDEIENGLIRPNDFEILQLSDDPSFPEQGKLSLVMGGGR